MTTSETFTRAQVADLIARSLEIGAVTGEQVGWDLAHAQVQAAIVAAGDVRAFSAQEVRRSEHRQRARREHDTAAVHPWRGDHPGGSVPAW